MVKCSFCKNYDMINKQCKDCNFEYDDDFRLESDDWSIFDLDDDLEWSHLQIQYRLKAKGIDCLYADIWYDNNLAYIIGAKGEKQSIARALNVNQECVYDTVEYGLIIINLFMEKYLRGIDLEL